MLTNFNEHWRKISYEHQLMTNVKKCEQTLTDVNKSKQILINVHKC